MRYLSLVGTAFLAGWTIWLLLLAYRVVGKPRGQDPKYDASVEYWSGTFKVTRALGIVVLVLELLSFFLLI